MSTPNVGLYVPDTTTPVAPLRPVLAAMQGSTEGTVKSRIFRAKERLYELLKEGEKND